MFEIKGGGGGEGGHLFGVETEGERRSWLLALKRACCAGGFNPFFVPRFYIYLFLFFIFIFYFIFVLCIFCLLILFFIQLS